MKGQKNLGYLEKQAERDSWYKIVVKINRWRDNILEASEFRPGDKISSIEWKTYCERLVSISNTYGETKTLAQIRETEKIIKDRGGFE